MTLTSQYIKFITDTQSRLQDEEVREIFEGLNSTNQNQHTNPNYLPAEWHKCTNLMYGRLDSYIGYIKVILEQQAHTHYVSLIHTLNVMPL